MGWLDRFMRAKDPFRRGARDRDAGRQARQPVAATDDPPPPEPSDDRPGRAGTPMVLINGRPASPDELEKYEVMTGMDLDGDGTAVGRAPGSESTDDRIAALERLAALRDRGVLTDAEFEAEKARILRSE